MADVPKVKLRSDIQEILDNADLSNLSAKKVRQTLELKYDMVLSHRKTEIDALTMELLQERTKKEDSSSDDDSNGHTKHSLPTFVRVKKEDSDSSEGPEDVDDDDDASYAKKVHREENNTRRRAAKKEPVKAKKRRSAPNGNEEKGTKKKKSGFTKDLILSEELAEFMGKERMPRCDVVKAMWAYIKDNNLKDPKDGRFAILDDRMKKIFKKNRIQSFSMMKYLSDHMTDPDKI